MNKWIRLQRFTQSLALGLLLFLPVIAQAAEEAEVEHEGIPTSVWFQFVNFSLYIALLVFLLRHPIKRVFAERGEFFRRALRKAEATRKDAEAQKADIQQRLTRLQATSTSSIEEARREADVLRAKIIADANDMVKSLREEAARTAAFEVQAAKNELRTELLNQSVALSTKLLKEKMAEPDQKRLQNEFVDKIQAVR